ncbi:ABC transporter permease subunit [Plantactinospora soyae]|uniref:Maltose/maltodextrin transport system permease protein n=1 Tax=Plantactinospora soyae TaxID=1544732 RepID=A0A927M9F6_9ACTN|nr:arabinogalactan oligomer/maltooligosaccharide transport system permease protein [Plantactinospora soyae]
MAEKTATLPEDRAGREVSQETPRPPRSVGLGGQIGKTTALAVTIALAVWAAFPLIERRLWVGLAIEVGVVAVVCYVYLSPRRVPMKYLLPGTLLLIAFQVVPVLYTVGTAVTNFGDGHRGSKDEAIIAIQTSSVSRVPGSTEYALSVATRGVPASDPLLFLLVDPAGAAFVGDSAGLRPLSGATVAGGRITAAEGYNLLGIGQSAARGAEITAFTVPTDRGAIRAQGISGAYEGQAGQLYDAGCDCVREAATGRQWRADDAEGAFVNEAGERLVQGWRVNVGLANFTRVVTDPTIAGPFAGILVWNLAFAAASALGTFALGLLCALALHSPRLRGRRIYQVLLILPYAMPSFAMLLIWRDIFNTDFGLLNRMLDLNVDWFGGTWSARVAVILVQLWLGYPYMFLVATGALQAIPKEVGEAAEMDGAGPWQRFRRVTLPLLLVALSPLLISSFAFNFNNFTAVYLTTEGAPFPADNSSAGGTDLLITYMFRLAFDAQGAQYGFAAAISVVIFTIVAIISAVTFRRTRAQEEVYS